MKHIFEVNIFRRMPLHYKEKLLGEARNSETDMFSLGDDGEINIKYFTGNKEWYERVLGAPVFYDKNRLFGVERVESSFYSLAAWPALYWRVDFLKDGSNVGFSFERGADFPKVFLGVDCISLGDWLESELCNYSDSYSVVDGWAEKEVCLMCFGKKTFRAEFVFDLLVGWKEEQS